VTIGSGVSEGAGVEFPTFPLTCVVVLKTLWHYRASVWFVIIIYSAVDHQLSSSIIYWGNDNDDNDDDNLILSHELPI